MSYGGPLSVSNDPIYGSYFFYTYFQTVAFDYLSWNFDLFLDLILFEKKMMTIVHCG